MIKIFFMPILKYISLFILLKVILGKLISSYNIITIFLIVVILDIIFVHDQCQSNTNKCINGCDISEQFNNTNINNDINYEDDNNNNNNKNNGDTDANINSNNNGVTNTNANSNNNDDNNDNDNINNGNNNGNDVNDNGDDSDDNDDNDNGDDNDDNDSDDNDNNDDKNDNVDNNKNKNNINSANNDDKKAVDNKIKINKNKIKTKTSVVKNNIVESNDYNNIPMNKLSAENTGSFNYGYSFMPPEKWNKYPVKYNCFTDSTCSPCPIFLESTANLKEWNDSNNIMPPDDIDTKYIDNNLNKKIKNNKK